MAWDFKKRETAYDEYEEEESSSFGKSYESSFGKKSHSWDDDTSDDDSEDSGRSSFNRKKRRKKLKPTHSSFSVPSFPSLPWKLILTVIVVGAVIALAVMYRGVITQFLEMVLTWAMMILVVVLLIRMAFNRKSFMQQLMDFLYWMIGIAIVLFVLKELL